MRIHFFRLNVILTSTLVICVLILASYINAHAQEGNAYVVTQGQFTQSITPHDKAQSATATYDYHSAEAHTNFELNDESIIFLYRNTNNNELSLFIVHDDGNGGTGGNVDFHIKNMTDSCYLEVKDDDGEISELSTPNDFLDWGWNNRKTDGCVISGLKDDFRIIINPEVNHGIEDINIVTGTLDNPNYIPLPNKNEEIIIKSKDTSEQIKWSFETQNYVHSSAAIGKEGNIYFGSGDNNIYALTQSGTVNWSYKTEGDVYSSPAITHNNNVVVGSDDGSVYMFKSSGDVLWTQDIGGKINSSPALGKDQRLYVGSSDGSLYSLSQDGIIQWSYSTEGKVESSPAIGENGTVYVGSRDGIIYAISQDGNKEWSYSTNNPIVSSPAIGANNTIYIGSQDGSLYALSQEGNKIWSFSTNSEINSSPVIGENGIVYFGAKNGRLYAISQKGNKLWSYSTGGEVKSSPAISSNGTIYFGSRDGKLYALSHEGKNLDAFQTGGDISSSPCIAKDGTIYIGSGDGKLYAIENDASGLYRSKWPMFHNKRRHSGLLDLKSPEIINITKVGDPPYNTVTWNWNATEPAQYRYAVTQNATYEFSQKAFNSTNELTLHNKHGEWYIHVQPIDMSGNLGPPYKDSVLLDNIPPEVELSGIPEKVSNSTSFSVHVSGDEVTHYLYRLDSGQYSQSFSVNTTIHLSDLDDGSHKLEVKGRDAAGNWQTNPTNASWTTDTTPPSPKQLKLNSSWWSIPEEHIALNSTVSELALRFQEAGSGLDLSASSLELVDGSNQEVPGSWRISGNDLVFTPEDPLPESVYTLNIRLRDELGNAMAQQSTRFFVDTTPPPAPDPDQLLKGAGRADDHRHHPENARTRGGGRRSGSADHAVTGQKPAQHDP